VVAAKKKPRTSKKPKAQRGTPKVAKVKKGKPKVAALAPRPELSCEQCVRNAADEWCGQHIVSSKTTLKDAFAPNGACNKGSLRALGTILKDGCAVAIDPDNLSCSMTLGELMTLVCGS
jgi:hypothetical protein